MLGAGWTEAAAAFASAVLAPLRASRGVLLLPFQVSLLGPAPGVTPGLFRYRATAAR